MLAIDSLYQLPVTSNSVSDIKALSKAKRNEFREYITKLLTPLDEDEAAFLHTIKHPNYISCWSDNVIVIHNGKSKIIYNLTSEVMDGEKPLILPLTGPLSPFDSPQTFDVLPNLRRTLKGLINHYLNSNSQKNSNPVSTVNNSLHFFAWMIGYKGVYEIAALNADDYDEYIESLALAGGWLGLLDVENKLRSASYQLLKEYGKKKAFTQIADITRSGERPGSIRILNDTGEKLTGWKINSSTLPPWFIEQVAGWYTPVLEPFTPRHYDLSISEIRNHMKVVNLMYALPSVLDKPRIYPFRSALGRATNIYEKVNSKNKNEGRTKNLMLSEAIALMKVSLVAIYDWAPGIIEIQCVCRERLEYYLSTYPDVKWYTIFNYYNPKSDLFNQDAMNYETAFREKLYEICQRYKLPCGMVSLSASQSSKKCAARYAPDQCIIASLPELVQELMSACLIIISVNHARRVNEIQGHGVDYGLYFGCIQYADNKLPMIDIYVEKTYQDYAEFYCNKLVQDAVNVLEDLRQAYRPLYETLLTRHTSIEKARKVKLFEYSDLSNPKGISKFHSFNFGKMSMRIFERAGVEREGILNHAHIFRRFFALIYYYRHDDAQLLALQRHLCHLNPAMTLVYISDPSTRDAVDRIERLYSDQSETESVFSDVRDEMFADTIMNILQGNCSMGKWPRLVLQFYDRLMADDVKFKEQELAAQSKQTAEVLGKLGYAREPHTCNGCNIGSSNRTASEASCYSQEDGLAHPDKASPMLCASCLHSDCSEHHLYTLERETEQLELQSESKNGDVPRFLRSAFKKQSIQTRQLIEHEKEIGQEFKKFIASSINCVALLTDTATEQGLEEKMYDQVGE